MIQPFLHVHCYGAANSEGKQRWFFRFALPAVIKPKRRGRPAAVAKAFCAERTVNGESASFWRPEDAALECDIWKLILTRQYGVKGLVFSHASYDVFTDAFRAKHGSEVEDYINGSEVRTYELNEFLKQYDEVLSHHVNCAESAAWNPHLELHDARKRVADIQAGGEGDVNAAYARKEWAAKWKDHCDLVADANAYGLSKLEYEVKIKVDGIKKILAAISHFSRPESAHRYLLPQLDRIDQDKQMLTDALKRFEETLAGFNAFRADMEEKTRGLKNSRP